MAAAAALRSFGVLMIFGAHLVMYSADADADREFLRDVLGLASVDAGHGWLIFALPPAEAAVHPATEAGANELYLMCDDLEGDLAALAQKGGSCSEIQQARWGAMARVRLPGGGDLGLYQPRHATALGPAQGGRRVLDPGPDSKVNSISSAKWLGFLSFGDGRLLRLFRRGERNSQIL